MANRGSYTRVSPPSSFDPNIDLVDACVVGSIGVNQYAVFQSKRGLGPHLWHIVESGSFLMRAQQASATALAAASPGPGTNNSFGANGVVTVVNPQTVGATETLSVQVRDGSGNIVWGPVTFTQTSLPQNVWIPIGQGSTYNAWSSLGAPTAAVVMEITQYWGPNAIVAQTGAYVSTLPPNDSLVGAGIEITTGEDEYIVTDTPYLYVYNDNPVANGLPAVLVTIEELPFPSDDEGAG